jgi:hypothetical protein
MHSFEIMNDELDTMWKEVVTDSFKALSWHLAEEAEENSSDAENPC